MCSRKERERERVSEKGAKDTPYVVVVHLNVDHSVANGVNKKNSVVIKYEFFLLGY